MMENRKLQEAKDKEAKDKEENDKEKENEDKDQEEENDEDPVPPVIKQGYVKSLIDVKTDEYQNSEQKIHTTPITQHNLYRENSDPFELEDMLDYVRLKLYEEKKKENEEFKDFDIDLYMKELETLWTQLDINQNGWINNKILSDTIKQSNTTTLASIKLQEALLTDIAEHVAKYIDDIWIPIESDGEHRFEFLGFVRYTLWEANAIEWDAICI
jgi:hypothetical protein